MPAVAALIERGADALVVPNTSLLNPLAGRISELAITHRLATIHGVDRIVVLEHGRIVEQGTGPDLVTAGGVYAKLYASGNYPT